MSKTVSVDTVALLAAVEALCAEFPTLLAAINKPGKSIYPVLDDLPLEEAEYESAKLAYVELKASVAAAALVEEEDLESGTKADGGDPDIAKNNKARKARILFNQQNVDLLADAKEEYARASKRFFDMRADAAKTFSQKHYETNAKARPGQHALCTW